MLRPLAAALLLSACDTAIHTDLAGLPDAAPTGKCLEAEQHSDFAWLRDNVLRTSCSAFGSCHQGSNPPGRLDLSPTHAFTELVGAQSYEVATMKRVVPFHPERSFLMVKLGAYPGLQGLDGGLMPPNSPPICSPKVEAVKRWIEQGAFESPVDAGLGSD